ncbi:MAG: trypsin-like serine protease [Nannocystaceae bacterium]|nr:trypsin-like serine protease [Nannocystaceae bacterium]
MNKTLGSPLLLALLALGCATEDDALLSDAEHRYHGEVAPEASLNAVGAMVIIEEDGVGSFCTGTLVAPDVVVTAKHCFLLSFPAEFGFAIGHDTADPDRVVAVEKVFWEMDIAAGQMGLGSDVAIAILEEPIHDIEPVKLGYPTTMGKSPSTHVWMEHQQVGYGFATAEQTGIGVRRKGTGRTQAVGWMSLYAALYDYDWLTFRDHIVNQFGEGSTTLDELWNGPRLAWNYDLLVRSLDGARVDNGDSGGPLLATVNGELVTYGAVSGVLGFSQESLTHVNEEMAMIIYSSFGPETDHMIQSAIGACRHIPEEGVCEGDTAKHCSGIDDGEPHVIETSCDTGCVDTPDGAACAKECTTDAQCEETAFGGECNDDGVCEWESTELCTGEANFVTCFYCCALQTDLSVPAQIECLDMCGAEAPPVTAHPESVTHDFPGFGGAQPEFISF